MTLVVDTTPTITMSRQVLNLDDNCLTSIGMHLESRHIHLLRLVCKSFYEAFSPSSATLWKSKFHEHFDPPTNPPQVPGGWYHLLRDRFQALRALKSGQTGEEGLLLLLFRELRDKNACWLQENICNPKWFDESELPPEDRMNSYRPVHIYVGLTITMRLNGPLPLHWSEQDINSSFHTVAPPDWKLSLGVTIVSLEQLESDHGLRISGLPSPPASQGTWWESCLGEWQGGLIVLNSDPDRPLRWVTSCCLHIEDARVDGGVEASLYVPIRGTCREDCFSAHDDCKAVLYAVSGHVQMSEDGDFVYWRLTLESKSEKLLMVGHQPTPGRVVISGVCSSRIRDETADSDDHIIFSFWPSENCRITGRSGSLNVLCATHHTSGGTAIDA